MLEVLREDYIRTARAKGVPARVVIWRHALRNALLPLTAVGGLQIGTFIAYTLLTETVFQWPGMGALFLKAVQNVDIPIMAAYLMIISALFVSINMVNKLRQIAMMI